MQVKKIAGALGAEISGLNVAHGLTPDAVAALREAFLTHLVIFIRGQPLTPGQFLGFAQAMGQPVEYPFVAGIPGFPHIIEVKKLPHETVNFGGIWHSDTTYLAQPPMGSLLLSREVPAYGGDTLFANQYLAYEALSDTLKRMLHGLRGISSSAKADVSKTREDRIKEHADPGDAGRQHTYLATHPLVRTHPETGRKSLYANVAHTVGIEGMTPEESGPILGFLFAHQVKPEFTCRFNWTPDCIAFWDNRCTLHNPVNDYQGQKRVMLRITLQGDTPI